MLVLLVSTSIVQGQGILGIIGLSRCNLGEIACVTTCLAQGYRGGYCGKGFFGHPDCKCTGKFPTTTTNTEPTNKFEFTSTGLVDSWLSTGEFPTTTTNTEPTNKFEFTLGLVDSHVKCGEEISSPDGGEIESKEESNSCDWTLNAAPYENIEYKIMVRFLL